jgi:outer membrane protein OmpA-like peptidoglycan-associated protein
MSRVPSPLVAAAIGGLLLTIGNPALAQTGPSQSDFGQALRPIPQALQGGHQGLPTMGAAMRPQPNPNYSTASLRRAVGNSGSSSHVPARVTHSQAADKPVPALAGCQPVANDSGKPGIGFPVSFEFGSAQLKAETLDTLRSLGKALNQDLSDQKLFLIEGHTDAVGTIAYNEELSKLRAEAVKDFLVRDMGVSAERLEVVGKAYCEPVNPQNPRGAENRRVVVINQSS